MSAYDNLKLAMIPSGYKDGKLYSVLPEPKVLSSELVTNGEFDTDSDWSKGTGCTISDGKAKFTSAASGQGFTQSNFLTIGKIYKVAFTVSDYSEGSVKIRYPFNMSNTITANGKYVEYGEATTDDLFFQNVGTTTLSIDSVSVVEVDKLPADFTFTRGTDATRVNAQGLVESVQIRSGELVQNGDFEDITSNLVSNGTFDTQADVDYWQIAETSGTPRATKTLEDGFMRLTYDLANGSALFKSGLVTQDRHYKVTFRAKGTAGVKFSSIGENVSIQNNPQYAVSNPNLTTYWQNYEFYVPFFGTSVFRFYLEPVQAGTTLDIDDISLQEVAQNWSFVGGSYFTGNSARIDNTVTGANAYIIQSNANFTQGKSILFQYDVVQTNGKRCVIEQIGDDIQLDTLTTGTKKQVYFVFDRADTNLLIKRAATGTDVTLDNISVIEVTDDTDIPRLDYTDGSCPALLLEPTRTNNILNSRAISNAGTVSVDLETGYLAPDGTYGAVKFSCDLADKGIAYATIGANNSTMPTDARSIYARTVSGTGTTSLCSYHDNTNNIFTITEEWQRFEVLGTTTTVGESNFYAVDFRLGTTTLTEVILWAPQSEVGDYVTSYIPTIETAVTRNTDNPQATNTTVFNDTEGVFYVEVAALSNDGTDRVIAIRNSTDNQEYLNIRIDEADNRFQMVVRTQGSNSTTRGINVNNALEFNKVAIRYKQGESFRIFANGNKEDDTGSAGNPTPSGLNQLLIQGSFIGKIKSILYFDTALTDQECIDLTT